MELRRRQAAKKKLFNQIDLLLLYVNISVKYFLLNVVYSFYIQRVQGLAERSCRDFTLMVGDTRAGSLTLGESMNSISKEAWLGLEDCARGL